jgi:hypothetical protein
MFLSGEAFLAICATAKQTVNMGNENILEVVIGTNISFALESYLKCLRMLKSNEYLPGHDLKELFDDLDADTKREITRRHELCEAEHEIFPRMRGIGLTTNLDGLLEVGKYCFQDFRYAYEEIPRDTFWGLDILMLITKHFILEERPDWVAIQLDRTPSPVPARRVS